MSNPRNHHYVSQCQIKNFFNKEKGVICVYDKSYNRYFKKTTSKSLFSEEDGNSKVINGQVNHKILEDDLNMNFENWFSNDFSAVKNSLSEKNEITEDMRPHLLRFAKYGIAGQMRSPQKKMAMDKALTTSLFEQILPIAAPKLKKELEEYQLELSKTKYANNLLYSEITEKISTSMGSVSFVIYIIKNNDFFILPDKPSISKREKINEYFNPNIKEIAMVGIPLSSKLFLHVESKKFRDSHDMIIEITDMNSNIVTKINTALYLNSHKQIACESEEYLKKFINSIIYNKS